MKSKNIKVAYSTRFQQKGTTSVPKIQMEGRWLEELGFSIGTLLVVEYEEGSIRIRPMSEEEAALKKEHELMVEFRQKSSELKLLEDTLHQRHISKVAESSGIYGA